MFAVPAITKICHVRHHGAKNIEKKVLPYMRKEHGVPIHTLSQRNDLSLFFLQIEMMFLVLFKTPN